MSEQDSMVLRRNLKFKSDILNRDRKCIVCGFNAHIILELHHIVPLSSGGNNSKNNLVILCPNCHSAAHKLNEKKPTERIGHYVAVLHNSYSVEQIVKLYSLCNS